MHRPVRRCSGQSAYTASRVYPYPLYTARRDKRCNFVLACAVGVRVNIHAICFVQAVPAQCKPCCPVRAHTHAGFNQQHQLFACLRVVHAVTQPPVKSQPPHALPYWFGVVKIAACHAYHSHQYAGFGVPVCQFAKFAFLGKQITLKMMEPSPPPKDSMALPTNWLGEPMPEHEPVDPPLCYTLLLREHETKPHYSALLQRLGCLRQ